MGVVLQRVGWRRAGERGWWVRSLEARVGPREVLGLEHPRARVRMVLADLLTGALRPSLGRVLVAGVDLEELSADQLARWRLRRVVRWRCERTGRLDPATVHALWAAQPELLVLEDPLGTRAPDQQRRVAELLRWMRGRRCCTCVLLGATIPAEVCDAWVAV